MAVQWLRSERLILARHNGQYDLLAMIINKVALLAHKLATVGQRTEEEEEASHCQAARTRERGYARATLANERQGK